MNARQRFLEVMNFNTKVPTLKWEFGYWGATIKNWYKAGLPCKNFPLSRRQVTTPTSSLYAAAWSCPGADKLSNGIGVTGGGLYGPTQSFPIDQDVRDYFHMDPSQIMVDVNLLFEPMFEVKVIEDSAEQYRYVDIDGVERVFMKVEATIPTTMKGPIEGWDDWRRIKAERFDLKRIDKRFPANWQELLKEYRNRDYPLALGGYPHSMFGTLAHLLGYEKLFYWYYDEPKLLHDMLNTFTETWLAVYEQVLSQVDVDLLHFWEDISMGKGPMVSLDCVREFMLPYYRRITDFLKARGVKIILVDTDGDCNSLIPLFLSAGVTGMYPFETHCGMDIVKVRKEYPHLQILGGVPKGGIVEGRANIDRILQPVAEVLKTGGFVPFGDHLIPPEVPWEEFKYYRTKLNGLIDAAAT